MKHTLALLAAIALAGCGSSYAEIKPVLAPTLTLLEGVARGTKSAVEGDFGGCVAAEAIAAAAASAREVVVQDGILFPPISVDVSTCLSGPLTGPDLEGAKARLAAILPPVMALLDTFLDLGNVSCRDRGIVSAALKYLSGITDEILDEVSDPDGFVSVSGVLADVAICPDANF